MTLEWLLRALATGALLGLAAYAGDRAAAASGRPRRGIWAAALGGALLLPLTALALPGALPSLPLPAAPAAAASPSPAAAPLAAPGVETPRATADRRPSRGERLRVALGLAWLAASATMLACLAAGRWWLRAAVGDAPARRVDGARVRVSERAGPMVLGVLHPGIVLPRWVAEGDAEARRLIVLHEREHLRAGDPRLLAAAALAVAAMPWNPLLWALHRRLRLAVEIDCDARVLAGGVERRRYGRLLLETAGRPGLPWSHAPGWGARRTSLEERIRAMSTRRSLARAVPLATVALAVSAGAVGLAAQGTPVPAPAPARPALPPEGSSEVVVHDEYAVYVFPDGIGLIITRLPDAGVERWTLGMNVGIREPMAEIVDGVSRPRRMTTHPYVIGVDPGSPADRAGVRAGDVLLTENGFDLRDRPNAAAHRVRPGDTVTVRVRRGEEVLTMVMVAQPLPPQRWPPTVADFEEARRQSELSPARTP